MNCLERKVDFYRVFGSLLTTIKTTPSSNKNSIQLQFGLRSLRDMFLLRVWGIPLVKFDVSQVFNVWFTMFGNSSTQV